MQELVEKFRSHVIELSNSSEGFIHHDWYVTYHLEIVEKIALELCEKYPEADKVWVILLVWLHDYGKIVDHANQYTTTLTAGKEKLLEFGFSPELAEKAISNIDQLDKKDNLAADTVSMEIKIASSADGASHLVGPFFYLWWYENSDHPYKQLMEENIGKATIDWDKKVVLPEVRQAFASRHAILLEQSGIIPEKFL